METRSISKNGATPKSHTSRDFKHKIKMKKYILILIAFAGISVLSSCKKDDVKPDCEVNKYATVTISNNSSNPYKIYIGNVFKVELKGGSISRAIKVNEGNNIKFYAVQMSGYILYPTEKTSYFNIVSCSDYSWQIP